MEELFDNILGQEEVDTLFESPEDTASEEADGKGKVNDDKAAESDKEKDSTTEETPSGELFEEEHPESVGSGDKEDTEEEEKAVHSEGTDASPNFYSSLASALAEDGAFSNSDEETISKVDNAEDFRSLIDAEIQAGLDDVQKRIAKALDNGVEPTDIRKYENTLHYISSITEADIMEESDKGEQLRKNLIYQDFLNKGYTPEKAQKFTERTIDAGTDIEDAKEALQSNREYFQSEYNNLLKDAQERADKEKKDRQKEADKLKESMLKDKQLLGDIEISNDIRKKAFDNISKPVYRDPDTGEYLTALQRYQAEHKSDFLKYVSLTYTLTDGFKNFDALFKGKVKKEVNKGLRELEHKLNSTRRTSSGGLKMVTNQREDPESFLNGNFRVAL